MSSHFFLREMKLAEMLNIVAMYGMRVLGRVGTKAEPTRTQMPLSLQWKARFGAGSPGVHVSVVAAPVKQRDHAVATQSALKSHLEPSLAGGVRKPGLAEFIIMRAI